MTRITERLSKFIDDIRWEDATNPSWWVQFARRQARLYFYIARETVRNRCLQQAAALTFTTLLSLVPLFAVAFSLFRGFESFKGLEDRAEEAIFRTMLAPPLMEGLSDARRRAEPNKLLERLAAGGEASAEELLEHAGKLPPTESEDAVALYIEAMARGARVREALSPLYFGQAEELVKRLKRVPTGARNAYAAAAGLGILREQEGEIPEEARDRYRKALALQDKRDYLDAIEELQLAQAAGYPAYKTLTTSGLLRVALADRLSDEDGHADAAPHYQAAADDFMDALVLGASELALDKARALVRDHNGALEKLGASFLSVGRQKFKLYQTLLEMAPDAAAESLDESIEYFEKAAALLDISAQVHEALGDALWASDRWEEARQHYKKAAGRGQELVARGFSTAAADYIRRFADKVGTAGIGVLGGLFLIVTATSLLSMIEKTLNNIWQVKEKRGFWTKFTSFCTLIWLGPVLIAASILIREEVASQVQAAVGETPILGAVVQVGMVVGRLLLPFVTVWLALLALYKFLPHTRVKFGAAAWGAFLGAVLIQIARPGFRLYVTGAIKYERIYGSLGLVPIFLLWVWLLWLLVLFGAEVAFAVQHIGLLRFQDKLMRVSKLFIDRYLAVRIMLYVAREFWRSGRPMGADRLAEILHMSPEEAADAANRMVKLGLLMPVGEERDEFHPARDLSRLKVMDVLSVTDRFRGDSRSTAPEDKPYEDRLEHIFSSAIAAQDRALEQFTFHDLLEACERNTPSAAQGDEEDGS